MRSCERNNIGSTSGRFNFVCIGNVTDRCFGIQLDMLGSQRGLQVPGVFSDCLSGPASAHRRSMLFIAGPNCSPNDRIVRFRNCIRCLRNRPLDVDLPRSKRGSFFLLSCSSKNRRYLWRCQRNRDLRRRTDFKFVQLGNAHRRFNEFTRSTDMGLFGL